MPFNFVLNTFPNFIAHFQAPGLFRVNQANLFSLLQVLLLIRLQMLYLSFSSTVTLSSIDCSAFCWYCIALAIACIALVRLLIIANKSCTSSTLLPPLTKATRLAYVIPRATGAAHDACFSHSITWSAR